MKLNSQSFLKSLAALVLMCGISTSAQAQFGGLLKKAKKAAEETVKKAAGESTSEAKGEVISKSAESVLGAAPECPWPMESATTQDQMKQYVQQLSSKSETECQQLGVQLYQRVQYDQKIIQSMEKGTLPYDGSLQSKADNEISQWKTFYNVLSNHRIHYVPEMMKQSDGSWSNNNHSHIMIPTGGSPAHVFLKNNKGQFCTIAGDAIFVGDAEVKAATDDRNFYKNTRWLLEEFAKAKDDLVEKMYYASRFSADVIGEAVANNSVENIERRDRPKAGTMNSAFHAKALQLAKQQDSSIIDCVITSDRWDVKLNAFGTPINRIIYGYVYYKDQYGTKASSRSWDQKYQGGKYGALGNHGVGAKADYYVK